MSTTGTYGLGTSVRTGAGSGPGLASTGIDQKRVAMAMLGEAAAQETQRNIANDQARQAAKAGNVQLGSTIGSLGGLALGAQYGAVGGPIGMAIGALVGAVAGGLF